MENFLAQQNIDPSKIVQTDYHSYYYIFYETNQQIGIYVLKGYEKGKYMYSHSTTTDLRNVFVGGTENQSFGMVIMNEDLLDQAAYIDVLFPKTGETERFNLVKGQKEYVIESELITLPFDYEIKFYSQEGERLYTFGSRPN